MRFITGFFALVVLHSGVAVSQDQPSAIPLEYYYEYDQNFPLEVTVDTLSERMFHITFTSVHGKRVPALLSLPEEGEAPYPVVIAQHGLGDHKDVDYMQYGDKILSEHGFAVMRIDFELHGERETQNFGRSMIQEFPYTFTNVLSQTVFDLRRVNDYLDNRSDIDANHTAFLGISLGGIAGTVFCGVEPRVEYAIIIIAGGGLEFVFGSGDEKKQAMMAPVEPLNFVKQIAPRPLLFINAEHDETIPKAASIALHEAAEEPKKIVWYDSGHKLKDVA
ncbi:MAG: hypothetical protein WBA23_22890, partial [Tunicatimonas sp.]|uniref:alpha/beta hydrolase family protein n=1 Tax=Tunicatimonas sp. TaxID=1940096 RepID=UPI003C733D84